MKLIFILLVSAFSLGIGIGYILFSASTTSTQPEIITVSPEITGASIQNNSVLSGVLSTISPTSLQLPMACDTLSGSTQDDCLFAEVIRSAKSASDTGGCASLQDNARCEKVISDQYSRQFNIPATMPIR